MLVCSTSGKLGDVSLFGGSTSDLLGGSMVTEDTKSKPKVEDVALESEVRGTGCWPACSTMWHGSGVITHARRGLGCAIIATMIKSVHGAQVGMDYTALRDFLAAGKFREAEDETRALLIRLAGEGAVKRGWVYFTEVRNCALVSHPCCLGPLALVDLRCTASGSTSGWGQHGRVGVRSHACGTCRSTSKPVDTSLPAPHR